VTKLTCPRFKTTVQGSNANSIENLQLYPLCIITDVLYAMESNFIQDCLVMYQSF